MTNQNILKKPSWIKVTAPNSAEYLSIKKLMKSKSLTTVCEEAMCPNIGECWKKSHATMMIMGDTCTRACKFCNIKTGQPNQLNPHEPFNVAVAVQQMQLSHVVITSVDRDDLDDGGAEHFYNVIHAIREKNPNTTIEVLTPDFRNKGDVWKRVVAAKPDVFNHNLETVSRLYNDVRPGARYFHSLRLLANVKDEDGDIFTKSGIMVGLGEEEKEVITLMDDLRAANVDFMTIGQYLRPTDKHIAVQNYVTPEEFKRYKTFGKAKGFLMIAASPLTRSSYHAGEDFEQLRKNKNK